MSAIRDGVRLPPQGMSDSALRAALDPAVDVHLVRTLLDLQG